MANCKDRLEAAEKLLTLLLFLYRDEDAKQLILQYQQEYDANLSFDEEQ